MKTTTEKTDVIFRYDTKGTNKSVFALFPHEVDTMKGDVTCYQHVGQHYNADYKYSIRTSRPATPSEYKDLLNELTGRGYNVNIVTRQNYTKYLAAYLVARSK